MRAAKSCRHWLAHHHSGWPRRGHRAALLLLLGLLGRLQRAAARAADAAGEAHGDAAQDHDDETEAPEVGNQHPQPGDMGLCVLLVLFRALAPVRGLATVAE